MIIIKFKDFIKESKGFALPVKPYADFIEVIALKYMNEYFSTGSPILKRQTYKSSDFSIPESEWQKLPISTMDLEVQMGKISEGDKPFYTTGFCFNMDEKDGSYLNSDGTIHTRIKIGIEITDLYNDSELENLKMDLRSTILHELNHAYEGYNRKIKGYPPLQDAITMATDLNTENVPEEVWEHWYNEIGYGIYYSEFQEMNAMVHDSIPWTSKFPVDEMKVKNITWEKAQSMIKFNSEEFKNQMIDLISSNTDENPMELMTKMKNGFADKIDQIASEKNEKNPSIDPNKIRKMSIDKFLIYIGERINSRGEILRRKILKTYSL